MLVQYSCTYGVAKKADGTIASSGDNFNWASSTCTYNTGMYAPSTTIATSTDIQIYGSLTAGEILMCMMMFVLIVIEMVKMLAHALNRIDTQKIFLGYSGGDVEIRKDL